MKKILFLLTVLIGNIVFIGGVKAYTEVDSFVVISGVRSCGTFEDELAVAKTKYKFNDVTGKFSLEGDSYNASSVTEKVYYAVAKDGYTLFAYVPNYDANKDSLSINAAPTTCATTAKFIKPSEIGSESTSPLDEPKTNDDNQNNSSDDNQNNSGDDSQSGTSDDGDESNNSGNNNNNNSSSSSEDVKTSENPKTGVSTLFTLLIPVALAGGTVLVFKKKEMFGF